MIPRAVGDSFGRRCLKTAERPPNEPLCGCGRRTGAVFVVSLSGIHHVDNVCCNAPCTGPLQRCDLPDELGSCVSAAAPAPALTPWGLIAVALLLVSAGAFTLHRRMRR